MEVFSVFATLSLSDLISGPLGSIKSAMRGAEGGVNSFGASMGNLTMAMAPVAMAAAAIISGLGLLAMSTIATEKALGELATLGVRGLAAVEAAALHASNTMAGITKQSFITAAYDIKSGIASLSDEGVAAFTALAAKAAQATKATVADMTNLGATAYGIHKRMYAGLTDEAFGGMLYAGVASSVQAFKTTGAAMNQAMSNLGAAATQAKRPLEEQLAVLGTLQNTMEASVAGTAYKSFFRDASRGFKAMGINAMDAAGQMRSMPDLLADLEAKLGPLTQVKLDGLNKAFGAETGAMIQNLLGKSGELRSSINGVGTAMRGGTGFINDMAASVNAGLGPSLALLRQRASGAVEELGKHLAPSFSALAFTVGEFMIRLQEWAKTPFVGFMLKIAGGFSTAILAVIALSASMWALSGLGSLVVQALAPIKAALLGISWPIWALIAAGAALYAAYKSNFGGIADIIDGWGNTISLVVRGVVAVFKSLSGSAGEIRGDLATEIKAAGLVGLVTTVSRVVFRIREFFKGIWNGLNIDAAVSALTPAILRVRDLFAFVSEVVGDVFGGSLAVAGSEAQTFGQIVGGALSWIIEGLATVLVNVVRGVDTLVSAFRWLAAVVNGDWATAGAMAQRIWDNLCASFMSIADLFRVGDWMRSAWEDAINWLSSINLYDAGAALMATLGQGIMGTAASLYASLRESLGPLGKLLPHSDAEEGPLSSLTLSGARIMSTMGEGVTGAAGALQGAVSGALNGVQGTLGGWWDGLFGQPPALETPSIGALAVASVAAPDFSLPTVPSVAIPEPPAFASAPDTDDPRTSQRRAGGQPTTITIHIGSITLPDVANGQDFVGSLQGLVAEYGGASA